MPSIQEIALVAGICMAGALAGAIALLVTAAQQLADIEIPPDADFFGTLQAVPITVPLALDLLDLAFDIFAAPIAWFLLEMLGLQALQMITVIEGLIPGTQLIPTMTVSWVIARFMKNRNSDARSALQQYQIQSHESRYAQLSRGHSPIADQYRRKALSAGPLPEDDVVDGEFMEYRPGGSMDYDEPPPEHFEDY
jgi:hypothetical protein